MSKFTTKDSGKRHEGENGFVRDTQEGKPRFDLMFIKDMPYSEQPITRLAELMARGAEKYNDRNWEQASSEESLARAKASLLRHAVQVVTDETDEDHEAAVMFNAMFVMMLRWKLGKVQP